MQLSIIEHFNELPEKAIVLLKQIEVDDFFLGYSWYGIFSKHVSDSIGIEKWLILQDQDEVRAILPMIEFHEDRKKVLHCLSNYYTPYFDIISTVESSTYRRDILELSKPIFQQYDHINLSPLQEKTKNLLVGQFKDSQFHCHTYEHTKNWQAKHFKNFDDYWSKTNSRLKRTIKRKAKNITSEKGFEYRLFIDEDIDDGLIDYHEVYFKSWKKNEPYPNFIDDLVKVLAQKKALRLAVLYKENLPIAAQIWFIYSNTAYIYKLAHDPYYGQLSAGTLLTHHLSKL